MNHLTNLPPKIRIKDIAKRANVSVGTVDRVLHNRGEVATKTKELIHSIINELEYKPNLIASALAMNKVLTLGVLIPSPTISDYWAFHLRGIEKAIKELNFINIHVELFAFDPSDNESIQREIGRINANAPDALLVVPVIGAYMDELIINLSKRNISYAIFDGSFQSNQMEITMARNAYQEGYIAAKMMSYGVSKETTVLIIAIGGDSQNNIHCKERIRGFKAYLNDHNITETKVRTIEIKSTLDEEVKRCMNQAFLDYSFVKGLFVCGSEVSRIAKFVDEKKLGNIRIIGFELLKDNVHYLKKSVIHYLITQKPEKLGFSATKNLINRLILKESAETSTIVPIDIITLENVDSHLIE